MSYETLMIVKNLLLFVAGMVFALIVLSLICAYYMMHTDINEEIEESIIFGEIPETKIQWKHPQNFLTALEMQYALLFWHFTNSSKITLYTNIKRGKILFISILIIFAVLLILALFSSFNIQPPPMPTPTTHHY